MHTDQITLIYTVTTPSGDVRTQTMILPGADYSRETMGIIASDTWERARRASVGGAS